MRLADASGRWRLEGRTVLPAVRLAPRGRHHVRARGERHQHERARYRHRSRPRAAATVGADRVDQRGREYRHRIGTASSPRRRRGCCRVAGRRGRGEHARRRRGPRDGRAFRRRAHRAAHLVGRGRLGARCRLSRGPAHVARGARRSELGGLQGPQPEAHGRVLRPRPRCARGPQDTHRPRLGVHAAAVPAVRAGVRRWDGIPQNALDNRRMLFFELHGFCSARAPRAGSDFAWSRARGPLARRTVAATRQPAILRRCAASPSCSSLSTPRRPRRRRSRRSSRYFADVPAADAAWAVYFLAGGKPRQVVNGRALREFALEASGIAGLAVRGELPGGRRPRRDDRAPAAAAEQPQRRSAWPTGSRRACCRCAACRRPKRWRGCAPTATSSTRPGVSC